MFKIRLPYLIKLYVVASPLPKGRGYSRGGGGKLFIFKVIQHVIMKMIRVDDNAHKLLNKVKKKMKEEGIENPTFSDAIRWLYACAKL